MHSDAALGNCATLPGTLSMGPRGHALAASIAGPGGQVLAASSPGDCRLLARPSRPRGREAQRGSNGLCAEPVCVRPPDKLAPLCERERERARARARSIRAGARSTRARRACEHNCFRLDGEQRAPLGVR
jgi:hypothetical protein